MLSINTNLSSLITQRSMKESTNKLNQAIERMTTGAKINHAKDNAANYSIATNLDTKIGSYEVAEDNTSMALDLLTTASDNLSLIQDRVQRLRDLQEQAANGTYGKESLKAINAECNSLVDEINRLYETTEYNGINLFLEPTELADGTKVVYEESNAQLDTTFKDMGITSTGFEVYDSDGNLVQTYDIEENDTIQDFFDTLQTHGFTTNLRNGVITIESSTLSYLEGDLIDELGIQTKDRYYITYTTQSNTILTTTTTTQTQTNTVFVTNTTESTTIVSTETVSTNYIMQTEKLMIETTTPTFTYDPTTILYSWNTYPEPDSGYSVRSSDGTLLFHKQPIHSSSGTITLGDLTIPATYTYSEENGCFIDSSGNKIELIEEFYEGMSATSYYYTNSVYGTSTGGNTTITVCESTTFDDIITSSETSFEVYFTDNSLPAFTIANTNTVQDLIDNINSSGKGLTASISEGIISVTGTSDIKINSSLSLNLFNYIPISRNTVETSTTSSTKTQTITTTTTTTVVDTQTITVTSTISSINTTTLWDTTTIATTQTSNKQTYKAIMENVYAPGMVEFLVGTNANLEQNLSLNISFKLEDISGLQNIGVDNFNYLNQIDNILEKISEKQVSYGSMQNRLLSVLEEISVKKDNLISSLSTIRDSDIAEVSSTYIQQQILQQASATLMSTANQSASIALSLI